MTNRDYLLLGLFVGFIILEFIPAVLEAILK